MFANDVCMICPTVRRTVYIRGRSGHNEVCCLKFNLGRSIVCIYLLILNQYIRKTNFHYQVNLGEIFIFLNFIITPVNLGKQHGGAKCIDPVSSY